MNERYYVEVIKITSSGAEERNLTPYDNKDTAIRKFHEAFNVIGGGPKFISAEVHDRYFNVVDGKRDYWEEAVKPEPEE